MPDDTDRGRRSVSPDHGPKSTGAPPSSQGRPRAEFVAWGPVRDAVTSIHNLETLLRSPRVGMKVLSGVLPEFLGSVHALRRAFTSGVDAARSDEASQARALLSAFTLQRLDELEQAMTAAASAELDARTRLALEQVVTRVSVDLDAAAELLDLAERADNPVLTELSLDGLARVSLQAAAARAEREVLVRLERNTPDCLMSADAHVLTRLLAFAVARAHAFGAEHVTIRAGCAADHARIRVEMSDPGDSELQPLSMRLVRRVQPTDAIVDAAARAVGVRTEVHGGCTTFLIARAG